MIRFVLFMLLALVSSSVRAGDPFDGLKTCFLLYNVKTASFEKVIGEEACRERLSPCSTFKVPLAVMAFDSGVLKDENQVLKWDGQKNERPEVNQDHNAKTWMRDSVVWFSQRLTPKIGKKKLQKYLDGFDYGNRELSAGLLTAWLTSAALQKGLQITAYEQVEFMRKLWAGTLPVTARSQQLTRDITKLEVSPKGFELHGKTGSGFTDGKQTLNLGWFIGHLQKGDQEYIVVANTRDLQRPKVQRYGGPKTKEAVKVQLEALSLW